jgi:2',3'-cyclic-nucleotide 2'-phosphodiesterase / 3'-nucleotidase
MRKNPIGRRVLAAFFVLALVLAAGSATTAQARPDALSITFLETSDVHGAIFPYNFIKAAPMTTSLAQVATLVAAERAKKGREVILMDGGDSLQGQPTVYYYNFQKTDVPHIWGEALNYLNYDAIAVGNHDIEAGHGVYDKLYKEVKAPVLCANAVKTDGSTVPNPYFAPYTVITRQGVKIAILGMITPKIPDWLPPQFWTGMTFADMITSAKLWVPIIQVKEKPDLIVGLFHAGVDYTYGGAAKDTPKNENAAQLVAEQVPGFDLIFVGHDHAGWDGQGWDPVAKKKIDVVGPDGKVVPILGPRNGAASVAYAQVALTLNKATNKYSKVVTSVLVPTDTIAPDPAFVAKFQGARDEVKAWVDRPVGKLAGKITTRDSMFGDSAFVDLIHRIQLEISADPAMGLKKADISFAAPLTTDATIPSSADGTMYVRDMFNLYQYENFLYTMDMTGQQIKDFLEYSYKLWLATMPNDENHILAMTKDKNGNTVTASATYNYDSAAGIKYTVDVTKPAGSRVTISGLSDGRAFSPSATYTVAINSYRGQGGGGHLTTGAGLDKTDVQKLKFVNGATTKDLRFYLLKWFEKQQGAVTVDALGNWKIVPEDLVAKGKATDFQILYPDKK